MLRVEREGGAAVLTLNRPEKRNALSIELREALAGALAEVGRDEQVRCTVVTGAGSAFCAGMDMAQFGGDDDHRQALVRSTEAMINALLDHPKPLVADVNGPALGGGFVLALLCDIRVARPGASFGFPEVERGFPASYGAARMALPGGVAAELCLTGRIVDYREAIRLGIGVPDSPVSRIAGLPARGTQMVVPWMRAPHPAIALELQAFRDAVLSRSPE